MDDTSTQVGLSVRGDPVFVAKALRQVIINRVISKSLKKNKKRATKLVMNFKKMPYDRLLHLIQPILKYMRLCGYMIEIFKTRMWANAQPDGRPAKHRWRPLFNTAKFG